MADMEIYRSATAGRGIARQVGRTLCRLESSTSVQVARAESVADIQAAQVDALSAITQRGLQGVAFISQVEQQLAQAVPLATTRLQGIADIGALGLSQVVMDTANKLRRI